MTIQMVTAKNERRISMMAFSRVSSGDSDILSPCDMNDEHA